jgi:hypothetical protein
VISIVTGIVAEGVLDPVLPPEELLLLLLLVLCATGLT